MSIKLFVRFSFQDCTVSDSVSALLPSVPNPCKNVCSHLCLLRPGGYTCTCPQGSSPVEFDSNECDAGKQPPQSICCRVCFAASRFTFMTPLFTRAWLLLCGFVTCVMLSLFVDSAYAWLLLPQPLRQPSQCPLHADA